MSDAARPLDHPKDMDEGHAASYAAQLRIAGSPELLGELKRRLEELDANPPGPMLTRDEFLEAFPD